ncbi:MAG: hypothetical protein E7566_07640 [Ruminococcaceae bacterium]|nr:hypothetical protein [Oscillospiraceae bacterium]
MKFRSIAQNLIITALLAVLVLLGSVSVFAETESYTEIFPEETSQISSSESIPENTERTLPEVDRADLEIPKAIGSVSEKDEPTLTAGFVLWIILGVAVAALLAVILTSKTKAYRSGGKKRYSTGNKMSTKTHLLNEKYYHKKRK